MILKSHNIETNATMHPVRRRKKRPNYGVRTVEVSRGKNGFGFTISGQHPCILSCIVPGSPAEGAGLRAGDYLVAVEGQSVSKVPHDEVVRLIGCCAGILKLQIAENYYSDSSDDEAAFAARQKPKYPHKYRSNGRHGIHFQNRATKVLQDSRSTEFDECSVQPMSVIPARSIKQFFDHWKSTNLIPPPVSRFHLAGSSDIANDLEEELYRVVVGYVGTIEMPRKLPSASRLQIVRGCIKKLRAEKRTHTAVLMKVMTRSLRLINGAGITLAIYPGDRVTFCAPSSEKEQKHFGIVTIAVGENPSSSCHIFAIDARPHTNHSKRAKLFKLECHIDPVTGFCREFPPDCEPIVSVIRGFYESNSIVEEPLISNSPQPSHDSTTTTSNSDSGIGFRDDCSNQPDRILVVDVQNQRLHIQEMDESGGEKLTVKTLSNPAPRSRSPLSTGSEGQAYLEDMSVSSGNTKSPDVTTTAVQNNFPEYAIRSTDEMSISSVRSNDALLLTCKLSPKVFSLSVPTSQSLEDLKDTESPEETIRINSLWGSLQDLRSFTSETFQSNKVDENTNEESEEGVSSWAASFEKLLEDQVGLYKFAEFLKKEFSHENIYFWVTCEKYRSADDVNLRREIGRELYNKHLALGAREPVNVDSHARQVTQEQLSHADPTLFLQAQKQIFNLMKFDSYPRFIKSELYKECVVKVLSGEQLTIDNINPDLMLEFPSQSRIVKIQKSRSNAEDRRRKSLLPWNRKSRTKSRDRAGNDISDLCDNTSVSSSRSSLTAWDVTLSTGLCRVFLPDGSTAVIHTKPNHSVRYVILRLLDKRALFYSDFQVLLTCNNKAVDVQDDSTILSGQEVRVEQRVIFKLDLPNKKTIVVKSKPTKTLGHVVAPILEKYSYKLDLVTLCLMSENEVIESNISVISLDNQRIQVLTRNTSDEMSSTGVWQPQEGNTKGKTLDEITNKVFEELLHEKSEGSVNPSSDQGSVRSEDWGSEHSSGILGRFLRRDSAFIEKQRKTKKGINKYEEGEKKTTLSKLPPLIAKLKPGNKLESRSESDVLYEGLKRAQRSRIEDQRGTEINFELPDFLKDKENTPQGGKKLRTVDGDIEKRCSSGNVKSRDERLPDAPPPLPPKPNNLSWAPPKPRPRPSTLYLDRPTSSFV